MNTGRNSNETSKSQWKPKVISLYLQNKALLYLTETSQQLTHHSTPFYQDTKGTIFTIKKGQGAHDEYLGSMACRALGMRVPPFFLAKMEGEVVFVREFLVNSKPLKLERELPFEQMVYMTAACALLGMVPSSRNILVCSNALYKINHTNMFQKLVSQTELEKSLLYPYQHCAFNPLAATASILMMRNDHAYLDSLRVFLITFNEIHFFNQLKQAHANYQCFSRDSTQAFIPDRLGEVCHRVGQNVRHLQLVMCSHWKSSFNQPMFLHHAAPPTTFAENPLTCLSQPLPEPQFLLHHNGAPSQLQQETSAHAMKGYHHFALLGSQQPKPQLHEQKQSRAFLLPFPSNLNKQNQGVSSSSPQTLVGSNFKKAPAEPKQTTTDTNTHLQCNV